MPKIEFYSAVNKNEITFARKCMELEMFSSHKINQIPFMFKTFWLWEWYYPVSYPLRAVFLADFYKDITRQWLHGSFFEVFKYLLIIFGIIYKMYIKYFITFTSVSFSCEHFSQRTLHMPNCLPLLHVIIFNAFIWLTWDCGSIFIWDPNLPVPI